MPMNLGDRLKIPPAEDILYEHLGYSIDLVAMALKEISEPPHSDPLREWFRQMSVIEVFWSQARILVEFFTGSLASTNTSAAEHFTKQKLDYDFSFGDEDIKTMMNDQIAHMNTARTLDPDKKLKPDQMWRVGAAIGRALKLFEADLTDDSRSVWECRTTGYQEIVAGYVYVSRTPDASAAAPYIVQSAFSAVAPNSKIVGQDGPKGADPLASGFAPVTGPVKSTR